MNPEGRFGPPRLPPDGRDDSRSQPKHANGMPDSHPSPPVKDQSSALEAATKPDRRAPPARSREPRPRSALFLPANCAPPRDAVDGKRHSSNRGKGQPDCERKNKQRTPPGSRWGTDGFIHRLADETRIFTAARGRQYQIARYYSPTRSRPVHGRQDRLVGTNPQSAGAPRPTGFASPCPKARPATRREMSTRDNRWRMGLTRTNASNSSRRFYIFDFSFRIQKPAH